MLICLYSNCLFSLFDLFWKTLLLSVLYISIGLNADPDPDPAYYLNADPFT
jgi:hypothetical protein